MTKVYRVSGVLHIDLPFYTTVDAVDEDSAQDAAWETADEMLQDNSLDLTRASIVDFVTHDVEAVLE